VSKEKIRELKDQRAKIDPEWRAIQAEVDKQVQEKLDAAGLGTLLVEARQLIEQHRQRLQSQADQLLGQIQALESVFGADEEAPADLDTDVTPVDDAVEADA
jgi:chromosome segregation ATPase